MKKIMIMTTKQEDLNIDDIKIEELEEETDSSINELLQEFGF